MIDASMKFWGVTPAETDDSTHSDTSHSSPLPQTSDSDEKYRFIAENGSQILCLLHSEKGCTYLSTNFERITGVPAMSAIGTQFFDRLSYESRDDARALIASHSAAGGESLRVQFTHADGSMHWYELSICPQSLVKTQDGQVACLLQNVQDHVIANDSLRKAREALEIALRARSEFLSGMSHELRTPLNAIIGFSEMMQAELFGSVDGEKHRDYLRHIQDSGYELLSKIEDLLALSRIEHADHRLHLERVDLSEPVHKAIAGNTYLAFSSQVMLESQIAQGDCVLQADRIRLQHAISNLIACAVRASVPQKPVTVSCLIEDYGALRFTVHCDVENAAAFAAQTVAARQRKTNASLAQGADPLRLTVAREIAQMHGGNVSVRATEGQGVEFLLRLPARSIVKRDSAKILEFASA